MAAAGPVAERIRRVLEEGRIVEPGDGPHRQGALDTGVGDVGCDADGTVGAPDAPQPLPAPGEITGQPRHQRDEASNRASTIATTEVNCSSSVPKSDSGWPAPAKALRAASRTCDPTSGRLASESPRSRPFWTMVWPPARMVWPAPAKPARNWNSCQTMFPQNTTHRSVALSATCSFFRATRSSLQILIIVGPPASASSATARPSRTAVRQATGRRERGRRLHDQPVGGRRVTSVPYASGVVSITLPFQGPQPGHPAAQGKPPCREREG